MTAKLRHLLRWFDAFLSVLARIGNASVTWLVALLGAPVLAASCWWYWKSPEERIRFLDTNKVTAEQQRVATYSGSYAVIGILLALPVLYFLWTRRKGTSLVQLATRAGAYATPLAAFPFILALSQKGIEKESPKLTLFFCAIIAAIATVATYRIAQFKPLQFEKPSHQRAFHIGSIVLSWACVLGMWVAYGYFFTNLAITNHHALATRTIDLGLYDNIFYNSSHGRPLACTFLKAGYHGSAHFDPILVVLSPLYRLYPRVELILGLQSFWCGSGVIPVFLIGRHYLGSRALGVMLAACYALHPALHGANMYEFHSLTLATVPILWSLYLLHAGRLKLYWLGLVVSVLVREDIPLMMVGVAFVAIILPSGKLRRTGFFTLLFSLGYFVIVKRYFMTSSDVIMQGGSQSYSYGYYYSEMIPKGNGLVGIFLTIFSNPTFALRHALEEKKVVYLITVFLPILFLPFAAKTWRLSLLYGLIFTTLATREAVFSTHFQYTNAILPFAFAALPLGIKNFAEGPWATARQLEPHRMHRALVIGALAASAMTTYKFGGIVENQVFKGGFIKVVRKLTPEQEAHYKWMEEAKALIPAKASVGVSQKTGPHVSNRKEVYLYGQKSVQYVFVDERELKGNQQKKHKKAIADGKLEVVTRRSHYVLYKFVKPKPKEKAPPEPDPDDDDGPADPQDVLGDEERE